MRAVVCLVMLVAAGASADVRVRGRVLFEGKPVTRFGVAFLLRGNMFGWEGVVPVQAPDGRFSLRGFRRGVDGTFVIVAPGLARLAIRGQTIDPEAGIDLGDLAMWRGFTIDGTVTDERGGPAAGAKVSLTEHDEHAADPWRQLLFGTHETTTDAGGHYAITGYAAIDVANLNAHLRAWAPDGRVAFALPVPHENLTIDRVVSPPGHLAITTSLPDGSSITVAASGRLGYDSAPVARGLAVLDVPAGEYKVGGIPVTVIAGATTRVTLR